ncbi:MAG: IclR family transcriptional regulator [Clostridiales bacterium]|nr:IclR family transcriptional regulator [Clostridiales bacterium]MCF8022231.1 IclR family transcriptional regulator [Clostridiales bacterium]
MLKVAHNVLELLEYLCSTSQKTFSVTELSKIFNTNKTAMYRMLRVLTKRGYLRQDEQTGQYMLDLKLLELGASVTDKVGLLEAVSPYMERLARETGETVNLAVLYNTKVVYIHKIESSHFLRTDLRVGTTVPAYCSALGKAMLAWLSAEEVKGKFGSEDFVSYTPKTLKNMDDFENELKQIIEQGYALDDEEYIPGIICIAAPVLNMQKEPIAAVSVAGPCLRMTEDNVGYLAELVCNCTTEISNRYGYR